MVDGLLSGLGVCMLVADHGSEEIVPLMDGVWLSEGCKNFLRLRIEE